MNTVIVVVMLVIGGLWLFISLSGKRSKSAAARDRRAERLAAAAARQEHPFQAVSLCSLGGGCAAGEAYGQRRFLVNESPPLPLEECTSKHCTCKYIRHEDRRYDGLGWRLSLEAAAELDADFEAINRRAQVSRGRRKTDMAA